MDMNNVNIEEIVKQVLAGMTGKAPGSFCISSTGSTSCSTGRRNSKDCTSCNAD